MKTYDLYKLAIKLLSQYADTIPDKKYTNKSGESATIYDVIAMLKNVSSWMYKNMSTDDICKVVRCKNCRHYKKYKKKDDFKAKPFYACNLDMKQKPPDFFCKNGDGE